MPTHVALLRAVNVGGVRIAMADLRRIAEGLGWQGARTHLNSGNLILRADEGPDAVAAQLADAIAAAAGARVPVLVRAPEALEAALAACPFRPPEVAPGTVQVAFLDPAAAAGAAFAWDGPERVAVAGGEAFVHFPDGVGRSKLTLARLERDLGVTATMRGLGTVAGILERC